MTPRNILLFGAGKSATVLIDYLIDEAISGNWQVTVADANKDLALQKTGGRPHSRALGIDINNTAARQSLISESDIVISMMPPALHILIARDCIEFGKSLLTASYADGPILELSKAVEEKGLLFLCEMGLDPGIDHMSAMAIFDNIRKKGGKITSFKSHCGGLVAPESDDNPWHYKISWNSRNVVLAGKAGALYRENGQVVNAPYESLFSGDKTVTTVSNSQSFSYSYYPNRNSLNYIELYDLPETKTFIRTTLRHPDFMKGWKKIIELGLTDETPCFNSEGRSLKDFYSWQFEKTGFSESWNKLKADNSNPLCKQLIFLGAEDDATIINKGNCSPADVLQFSLESKLVLHPHDKDLIVMLHEIEYELSGKKWEIQSSLVVTGKDHLHTAMALTVGLPLGIAAKMILNGTIQETGIRIPTQMEIYLPVLEELKKFGIAFQETEKAIN